jgi:DNA-binding NtrC family response regulator
LLETEGWNLSRLMERCERDALAAAMQRAGGNQSRAARLLGITARSVYSKMHKHWPGTR